MTAWLLARGEAVNRMRVQRLLRRMGLEAVYPKPSLSAAGRGHQVYPYFLRGRCPQDQPQSALGGRGPDAPGPPGCLPRPGGATTRESGALAWV
jgi:hypothetical protein